MQEKKYQKRRSWQQPRKNVNVISHSSNVSSWFKPEIVRSQPYRQQLFALAVGNNREQRKGQNKKNWKNDGTIFYFFPCRIFKTRLSTRVRVHASIRQDAFPDKKIQNERNEIWSFSLKINEFFSSSK